MRLTFSLWVALVFAVTANLRAADVSPRVAVQIRNATYHNMLRYAPELKLSRDTFAQCPRGSGLFVIDINYVSGLPDDVRMVKSTGCPVIDKAVISTLMQWRFMPHSIYKATMPVSFDVRGRVGR